MTIWTITNLWKIFKKPFTLFVDEVKPGGFALLYDGDASVAKIKLRLKVE